MAIHNRYSCHMWRLCGVGLLFLLAGCSSTSRISIPVYSKPVVYAGIGAGSAQFDVNTDDQNVDQIDSTSSAIQITAGLMMADNWGIELRFADLGDAKFDNDLKLGYQITDLSLTGQVRLARKARAFLRLGAADLSSDGDFEVREQQDIHSVIGLGLDFDLSRRLGLRAEVSDHDVDAQHAQLSLVYRFNPRTVAKKTTPVETVVEDRPTLQAPTSDTSKAVVKPVQPAKTPIPTITPKPAKVERQTRPRIAKPAATELPEQDADNDSVVDAADQCPGTAAGAIVNDSGCALFGATLPGVVFAEGSITLDASSQKALDVVVDRLNDNPELQVTVAAYSPRTGDAAADLLVSRRRTIAVLRYFRAKGIAAPRIRPNSNELVSESAGESLTNRIAITRQ